MNEKAYYSLRFLGTNTFHKKGDVLKSTNKTLNIGETADCEVRYEDDIFEPEYYATIIENEDGKGWRLIQRSQYVKGQIAGIGGFGYVHLLKDGDVISFDGQSMELEFHIHHDSFYGKTGIVIEQRSDKRTVYSVVAAVLTISLLTVWGLVNYFKSDEIRYNDVEKFFSSVFMIKVDSVQWIEIKDGDTTLVRPTMMMDGKGVAGTAFLTTTRKMVTARHCIEYWIGEEIDITTKTQSLPDDDIKKWAILCEKYMQEREDDTSQQLRVFFSFYDEKMPDKPVLSFSSTDPCVHINRSRDGILELGDFSDTYYWRTICPVYNDYERELGDIVYIDVDQAGTIEKADSMMINELKQTSNIAILGYPNISSGKKATFSSGKMTESRSNSTIGVSPDLLFDANITHGFSGGPVFIKADGKIVVAGVVSKIDTDNGIYKKAVPITEIMEMEKKGKEVE